MGAARNFSTLLIPPFPVSFTSEVFADEKARSKVRAMNFLVEEKFPAGLEKSGRLVAICDQKIFLATRSWAAVVKLATNFSTKGPVWRPQFCARFHVRTNGTVWRPEKEQQVSENEIQIFENLSRYSRNVNLALFRPPPPPNNINTAHRGRFQVNVNPTGDSKIKWRPSSSIFALACRASSSSNSSLSPWILFVSCPRLKIEELSSREAPLKATNRGQSTVSSSIFPSLNIVTTKSNLAVEALVRLLW